MSAKKKPRPAAKMARDWEKVKKYIFEPIERGETPPKIWDEDTPSAKGTARIGLDVKANAEAEANLRKKRSRSGELSGESRAESKAASREYQKAEYMLGEGYDIDVVAKATGYSESHLYKRLKEIREERKSRQKK